MPSPPAAEKPFACKTHQRFGTIAECRDWLSIAVQTPEALNEAWVQMIKYIWGSLPRGMDCECEEWWVLFICPMDLTFLLSWLNEAVLDFEVHIYAMAPLQLEACWTGWMEILKSIVCRRSDRNQEGSICKGLLPPNFSYHLKYCLKTLIEVN